MKIGYLKLLISCTLLFILFAINAIFNIFSLYTLALFLLVILIGLKFLVGFEKDRVRFKNDIILMVLIYMFIYYILTYLSGLFLGFNLNGYSLKLINIFKNAFPILILIVVAELIRYTLVVKGSRNNSILILSVLVFIMFDVSLVTRGFDFSLPSSVTRFVVTILLPSISKNIMLSYVTYKVGYKPAVLYRLLMEIPIYFLPIFPALGIYIDSVFKVLFPAYLIYEINKSFSKIDNTYIPVRQKSKFKLITAIISFLLLTLIIGLTCGLFKYYVLTIGSGSMEPAIYKGDVIVVKKVKEREIKDIDVGNVLIFKYEKTIVVHRVIEIVEKNNRRSFFTQGDNNESPDGWEIKEEDIIGVSTMKIPFIGYPTVWLNELISSRG